MVEIWLTIIMLLFQPFYKDAKFIVNDTIINAPHPAVSNVSRTYLVVKLTSILQVGTFCFKLVNSKLFGVTMSLATIEILILKDCSDSKSQLI